MPATDLERLVVSLEAQSVKLDREITRSANLVDSKLALIEKRTDRMKARVEGSFTGAAAGVSRAMGVIGIALSAQTFIGFIKGALEAADRLQDLSAQAGLSVETIQALQFAGIKSGVAFDDINDGLLKFNKTLGQFLEDQSGPGAKAFEHLGIAARIAKGEFSSTQEVFRAIITALYNEKNGALLAADASALLGKSLGPRLVPLIKESGGSLDNLVIAAKAAGVVLSDDLVNGAGNAHDALQAMFFAMSQDGTRAVAALAPAITGLTSIISDQTAAYGTWATSISNWLAELRKSSPVLSWLDEQVQNLANTLTNFPSVSGLGLLGALLKKFGPTAFKGDQSKSTGLLGESTGKLTLGPKAGAADAAAREALARREALNRLIVDQTRANADLTSIQDKFLVQQLAGQIGYYAAVLKQIGDEKSAKLTTIQAEEAAQIASLDRLKGLTRADRDNRIAIIKETADARREAAEVEAKAQLDATGSASVMRQAIIDGDKQIQQYQDETAALGLVAGAAARLAFIQGVLNDAKQKGITLTSEEIQSLTAEADAVGRSAQAAHDATVSMQDNVAIADELRTGLADVAVAGLHGFKSLKDAAGQFLETLAEMIIRLYVMKPLLESLLGPSGSPLGGGGGIGTIFSSIFSLFGFAGGGVMTPTGPRRLERFAGGGVSDKAAIFGEAGAEAAVPLPDGRSIPVSLRVPTAVLAARTPQVTVYQTVYADRSILADDVFRQIERSKKEAISEGSQKGATIALRAQPAREQSYRRLGT